MIETVKSDPAIKVGAATDGDADRIGMLDQYGEFVDSHHLLLLLLYYQHHFKKQKGKVLITFSVTDKVKKLADLFGVECEVTKIGFKYISEIMMHTPILVAGEESGGIAVAGHIPERDGVWIALTILEFMASTGKSLTDLINEVYAMVGAFKCDRDDLHLDESKSKLSSRPVKIGHSPLLGHIRSNLSKIWTAISFCLALMNGSWSDLPAPSPFCVYMLKQETVSK